MPSASAATLPLYSPSSNPTHQSISPSATRRTSLRCIGHLSTLMSAPAGGFSTTEPMWTRSEESSRRRRCNGLRGMATSTSCTCCSPEGLIPTSQTLRASILSTSSPTPVPSCRYYTWYVRPAGKSLTPQLHQPLAIDEKDSDGHTALMWAAYQGECVCSVARPRLMIPGDAISVDLLLRHGASVATADNAGMTPLHWAAVKGSKACIKHIVAAGADMEAKEEQGKTPKDMAEELKGLAPFNKGLEEAGYSSLGAKRLGKLSEVSDFSARYHRSQLKPQRNTTIALFILPTVVLFAIFNTFAYLPAYTSWPLAFAEFWAMQIVRGKPRARLTTDRFEIPLGSSPGRRPCCQLTLLCIHHHRKPVLGLLDLGHQTSSR